MIDTTVNSAAVTHTARPSRRQLRWFFPAVSGTLLAVLVVGFAPSFFLRGLINTPFRLRSIPPYLVLHGVVLTTWYVLVFAQTCLVAAHRTDLHRRLGVLTLGIAVLIIPVSSWVVVRAVSRLEEGGVDRAFIRGLVVGDLLSLAFFSLLVGAAFYFRRRPDVHKRLMIFASVIIFGPVLERYFFFYRLPRVTDWFPFIVLFALGAYDLILTKRLHRVTILAGTALPIAFYLLIGGLMTSGAADALVNAFR